MQTINVPTRAEVSPANQEIFDNLQKALGFVPNLYATFAHSADALGNYVTFQNAKSSITGKAREVVNLVVSQVNECQYCLAAHTKIGQLHGFTDAQILEIRSGRASFDAKLDALAVLSKKITIARGHTAAVDVQAFFDAGWTKGSLIDALVIIGDKTISNYLHSTTQIPVDFPSAPALVDVRQA